MSKEKIERNKNIRSDRKTGASFKELSTKYGVSIARIQQINRQVCEYDNADQHNILEIKQACEELRAPIWMNTKIQNVLKRNKLHLYNRWRTAPIKELYSLVGIGRSAIEIIEYAKTIKSSSKD